MNTNIIEVRNLSKQFGNFQAVREVSFSVESGEIFAFLGPNGAGKTTIINMLTGLAKPTSGSIYIAGCDGIKDIKSVQQAIGVVPDESNLYEDLSGYDNLVFCASLYGMGKKDREARARKLLEQFDLADTGNRPFKAYSKGMKRKLTIAAGIIHAPKILFLDEPTTGIDVESARRIRRLVRDLNGNGTTIFLTTHYIEEAERLCSRVGFIVYGKVVRIDSIGNLMKKDEKEYVIEFTLENHDPSLYKAMIQAFPGVKINRIDNQKLRIIPKEKVALAPFINFFEEFHKPVYEARIIRPTLEDVFVKITGIELAKMKKEKEGQKK
ncbi:putative ABC transporter ATP-binding protein YfiL (plasmid) [Peptoclostridium acidaminophilum DSM 3953]|uniref:Putative ABC transporter ATP-binding protein YfiL n=1 Tax=Peptoclostridium acidaminophilum DSM 3953 TaxID=1286171 RepID=W8T8Z6_PEPAC|nr:ATP-binding cassette domain-containing protein [Peptoclostridium acidaminophilum]AHM58134.1 putative ABC transporter ATP-binding protein YfiL [Peptoclostridium acidaminophilum DSM 3953]